MDKVRSAERPFTMVYNDFLRMPENVLSHYDKIVFIAIKSYAGSNASAFPSINTLHRVTGISRQWVQKSIAHLIDLGFLRKEKRQTAKSGNISNLYTIYETEEMCRAGTVDEVKKAAETSDEDKAIETLARLGYTVIPPGAEKEKEQSTVGAVDRSVDEVDLISGINYNSTHEKLQEKYSLDQIKSMMDYDVMTAGNPLKKDLIDGVIHVIYNAVNTTKETIRVGQENRPTSVVISQLLKLDHMMIIECIDRMLEASANEPVKNPQSYLLTALYNAVTQPIQTASQVAYDTAHWSDQKVAKADQQGDWWDNC